MVSKFTSDLEKTLQFQDSLPSLPAPDLDVTLKKYLESGKVTLSYGVPTFYVAYIFDYCQVVWLIVSLLP